MICDIDRHRRRTISHHDIVSLRVSQIGRNSIGEILVAIGNPCLSAQRLPIAR